MRSDAAYIHTARVFRRVPPENPDVFSRKIHKFTDTPSRNSVQAHEMTRSAKISVDKPALNVYSTWDTCLDTCQAFRRKEGILS